MDMIWIRHTKCIFRFQVDRLFSTGFCASPSKHASKFSLRLPSPITNFAGLPIVFGAIGNWTILHFNQIVIAESFSLLPRYFPRLLYYLRMYFALFPCWLKHKKAPPDQPTALRAILWVMDWLLEHLFKSYLLSSFLRKPSRWSSRHQYKYPYCQLNAGQW